MNRNSRTTEGWQWRMVERCRHTLLDGEGKEESLGNRECKSSHFLWKRFVSSLWLQVEQEGKKEKTTKHCPWIKRKKKYGHEGWWTGVKIKIYILMEKRVPHRPWSKHWFEVQSILRLWCWKLPQRQSIGLTCAVFILPFNEKMAVQCEQIHSFPRKTDRARPGFHLLHILHSLLTLPLTFFVFNLFFLLRRECSQTSSFLNYI